jgi:rhamnogalacturonyl hydrolase YesR
MMPRGRGSRLISLVVAGLSCVALNADQAARDDRRPLDIARLLAARYPESPIMSYIPGLAWASSLRLAQLTGEEKWKEKPRRDMQAFLSGAKPAIAQPYLLTSLAGHLALSDLGVIDGDKKAAALAQDAADYILTTTPAEFVRFRRNWTDDMFMASTLLSRVAAREKDPKYGDAIGRLLTTYAKTLQRPDGLFIHAVEGPHAWGRGNGFALLGLTEALTYLPDNWSDRPRVLEIYRRHVRALLPHQSEDGSWRQVVDDPGSYRELTVTAMTVAAMARGVRRGWLEKDVVPAIDRGWQAVLARVNVDGTLKDVCAGTGAGPTKEYYLNRPAVNGADDRGGAMALLAAIEIEELRR